MQTQEVKGRMKRGDEKVKKGLLFFRVWVFAFFILLSSIFQTFCFPKGVPKKKFRLRRCQFGLRPTAAGRGPQQLPEFRGESAKQKFWGCAMSPHF